MEAIALMAFILNSVGKVICVPVRTGSGDAAVNLGGEWEGNTPP